MSTKPSVILSLCDCDGLWSGGEHSTAEKEKVILGN